MSDRLQEDLDFDNLHIEFMNALDSADRWRYMTGVHPSIQPNVWRECLEVALNKLNGIKAPTHRGFSSANFRNEINLCRMFLLGQESCLNRQGKTMLKRLNTTV